jgi:hypothetical protein
MIGALYLALYATTGAPSQILAPFVPEVIIILGGVGEVQGHVRLDSLSLSDELNHEPNNVSFRIAGITPHAGQDVQIFVGARAPEYQEFGGHILSVSQVCEAERPALVAWDVQGIDYTWILTRRKVLTQYANVSATIILAELIRDYTGGVIGNSFIDQNLPVIDAITFTNEDLPDAISRVMDRIGGYWYLDYQRQLHAFLVETTAATPITDAAPATMVDIKQEVDLSQVATRVLARGGGGRLAVGLESGATALPLEEDEAAASWYAPGGGVVEVGTQRVAYSAVFPGGTGSTVSGKPSAAPPPPVATAVAGAGALVGSYSYRVTFVTGGAETPSSGASNAISVPAPPVNTLYLDLWTGTWQTNNAAIPAGTFSKYRVTFVAGDGAETFAMESDGFTMPPYTYFSTPSYSYWSGGGLYLSQFPTPPAGALLRFYRSDNGKPYRLVGTRHDLSITYISDTLKYEELSTEMPAVGYAPGRATVSGIALGPAGTTARKLYRTGGADASYRLLVTVGDNTTTTYDDTKADDTLGGIAVAEGTIGAAAGDTGLQVADLAAFPPYGWVMTGNQFVRYYSRSALSGVGMLRDIPASGSGSITAPISVNTEVVTLPQLVCTPLRFAVEAGIDVNIVAQADDAAAQAAMAQYVGYGDGIHEMHLSDGRWGLTESTARARAELTRRKDPQVRITFDSRDRSLQSGRGVTIATASPAITGTFTIQRVGVSEFGLIAAWPKRSVECSSVRVSFEDLLRQIRGPQ